MATHQNIFIQILMAQTIYYPLLVDKFGALQIQV